MPRITTPTHARAGLIALFVTFLWSSSWVMIRWGLDEEGLTPLAFAALRYGIAATALGGWVVARPRLRAALRSLGKADWLRILALGVVFYSLTQGAQFVAIDSQPAATSSLVLSWTPLLVVAFGSWSISETASRRQVYGALLVVAGAWLYFSGDLGATLVGMAAAIVGLLANVTAALLGRRVNRENRVPPVVITALSMGMGASILLIVAASTEGMPIVTGRAWGIIAWLALVNTAWAFTLWNISLRTLSALESAAINNTMLIQIALLAWVFLGEALGLREGAGILLVTVGILLTQTVVGRPAAPRRSTPG